MANGARSDQVGYRRQKPIYAAFRDRFTSAWMAEVSWVCTFFPNLNVRLGMSSSCEVGLLVFRLKCCDQVGVIKKYPRVHPLC